MENSEATYEAFDGVELHLRNGRIVRSDPLTVQEAVRYLRLLTKLADDATCHEEFIDTFPARIGLLDVPLADLGLEVDGVVGYGTLDVQGAISLAGLVTTAAGPTFERATANAQAKILDEFPETLGVDGTAVEVFAVARAFTQALYEKLYGMARDFLAHLTHGPKGQVLQMVAPAPPQGSTT